MTTIKVQVAGATDVGLVRKRNEDMCLIHDLAAARPHEGDALLEAELCPQGLLLAVLDGMGGTRAGDRASALAWEVLAREVKAAGAVSLESLTEALVTGALAANWSVFHESRRNPSCRGMGTTLTAASVWGRWLVLAQVGDSRAYLLRRGALSQLTEDQALDAPQVQGDPPLRHSNVILQALGISAFLEPTLARLELRRGDLLMLCSDGLSALVPADEMAEVLQKEDAALTEVAAELLERARGHGGYDNATVLLCRLSGDGLEPPGDPEGEPAPAAEPITSPALEAHLRRRRANNTFTLVGLLVLLIFILAGLIVLLVSCVPAGGV